MGNACTKVDTKAVTIPGDEYDTDSTRMSTNGGEVQNPLSSPGSSSTGRPTLGERPKSTKLSELLRPVHEKQGDGKKLVADGREGWLYREPEEGKSNEQPAKIWAALYEHRLEYYRARPAKSTDLVDGYVDLTQTCQCSTFERDVETSGFFGSKSKKLFFRLADASVTITFSAGSESEGVDWVNAINESISGVRHVRPRGQEGFASTLALQDPADAASTSSGPKRGLDTNWVSNKDGVQVVHELPYKTGEMEKLPIHGSKYGYKAPKTRWFKLESGELSYYSESTMRASSLKRSIVLEGCKLDYLESKDCNIVLKLPDNNTLQMQAYSKEAADEWRKVIHDTTTALTAKTSNGKARRINVANETSNETDIAPVNIQVFPKSPESLEIINEALVEHFLTGAIYDKIPIINALKPVTAVPGDVIIWQGAPGDLFYILESGSAEVLKNNGRVGTIEGKKAFGELALMNSAVRAATIRVTTPSKLWTLDRKTFRNALAANESQQRQRRIEILRGIKIFEKLTDSSLGHIADVLQQTAYAPGQRIVKQGDAGDAFYILERGTVSVTQSSLTGGTTEITRLTAVASFGELALISKQPRAANVTAVDSVSCLKMDVAAFNSVLGTLDQVQREDAGLQILKKVELLSGLSDRQLVTIARCLRSQTYTAGQDIITQGEYGDDFFMIASGEVSVKVNHVEVAKLSAGSYFGEMSLMNKERRNATVVALGAPSMTDEDGKPVNETTCLLLSRSDFNNLLGPLEAILKAESEKRATISANSGISGLARSFSTSMKRLSGGREDGALQIQLRDLKAVRVLGSGTFGLVKLVVHRTTGAEYALKTMHKKTVLDLRQEKGVYRERDLMRELESPLLPSLYATFTDSDNLYMVLEYLPGGEFWGIMHEDPNVLGYTNLGGLPAQSAVFYAANVVAAISHMHSVGICYRDLKPENMVLDKVGYIKIVDLGFCKRLPESGTTNTMCGTPEYIAPEMVQSKPHNRAVDIWAIGVFIYELITRCTPFQHTDISGIYQRIIKSQEVLGRSFKPGFPPAAKLAITRFLVNVPTLRIGMMRNGYDDIWNQPFFTDAGISQAAIESRSIPPPYRPHIPETPSEEAHLSGEEENVRYTGKVDFSDF